MSDRQYYLAKVIESVFELSDAYQENEKAKNEYGYRYDGCYQQQSYNAEVEALDRYLEAYARELFQSITQDNE